ncbi:MAG: hypothetical protein ACKVOE_00955 [Rickettsiales bacterium]
MFAGAKTADIWQQLQNAYEFGDRVAFIRLLSANADTIKHDHDELRLLFFAGKEFDEPAYKAVLTLISDWRWMETSDEKRYRCDSYLYAVRHTLPPKLAAAKPYLIPLFLDAANYRQTSDPDTPPHEPLA